MRLHNPTFGDSAAAAAHGDWQGGVAAINFRSQPVLWNGSSGSWVNLAQSASDSGMILGMSADRQVGRFNLHATLWSGTPGSRIDLHPGGVAISEARAAWGSQQVGWAGTTVEHAALWHGSASSFVDLHPTGAVQSRANAVADGRQGGLALVPFSGGGTVEHAAIWSGTAASFVDLNPPGALGSAITAMWPGQQVGGATWIGGGAHAGYWTDTPESFVDLHPSGAGMSAAWGTCGTAQVGIATFAVGSAVVWFGTAQSAVNLHDYLPSGQYAQSEARAVSFHNGQYYIAGRAWTTAGHVPEAWLWVGVPAPGPAALMLVASAWRAGRRQRR